MPGFLTRAGARRALDGGMGYAAPAAPTGGWNQMYLGLATTAWAANARGTEYGATGYARRPCALAAATAADPPVTSNTAVITFGPFTAGTGATITHAFLTQASSAGAIADDFAWWTLTNSRTPGTDDSCEVAIGALTMSISVS